MPLFELDEGRLVPAQFGRPVAEPVEPEVLQAVREQVLEVVAEPLFPVTWHDDDARPRLTAMDSSGQVVTVEVAERLDAVSLVAALSRAGRTAERGWLDLAETYPRGVAAFRRDWNAFRESMPPRPTPGPRLVVVAAMIDDEIRPALGSLAGSGVLVHEMSVRQMSNGRRFLDVTEVRGGLAAHPAILPGRAARRPELSQPIPGEGPLAGLVTSHAGTARETGVAAVRRGPDDVPAGSTAAGAATASAETHGRGAPVADARATPTAEDAGSGLARAVPELRAIAGALDGPAGLVWAGASGTRYEATLLLDGRILAGGAPFPTPEAAAVAVSGHDRVDGWEVWRFGDEGPSLAEARAEVSARLAAGPAHDREPVPSARSPEDGGRLTRRERRRRGSTA
ncbi:hypothetical protein V2J56_09520 [Georgenia sp. MJ206]|uniref:restriction system modified-DNA reader domain-containing protein n=1 Tax=Georgenia wangjunii TaxID=3117730 RepID=UPI002F269D1F